MTANYVFDVFQESGVFICHVLKDNSLINKVKLPEKASKIIKARLSVNEVPKLPQISPSPLLASEPTNSQPYLPGGVTHIPGPSCIINRRW
ncbi:hypothetical protein ACJMK2_038320, partial [Sinanodonta woodiana]